MSTSSRPALGLLSLKPLRLVGVHFKSGERVRVTVTLADGRATRVVRASSIGVFIAGFGTVDVDVCSFQATARGAAGSRAAFTFAALAELPCPVP